jgi:recombination protein RecA
MSSTAQPANAQPTLPAQLSAIEREYGKGTVMRLGDDDHLSVQAIPTGALPLDLALGIGGVPLGRIVELYGPEASGKTTIVYHIIAQAQKLGGACAFIDSEHALDPTYASRIGVNVDDLLVCQPDYGEQALQVTDMLVKSGELAVVAIDSVAALTPRAEIEGQIGDQSVGLMARMMSQALRKLAGSLRRANTLCVFTNQLREKIGVIYGSPEVTPGGRALKFYASVRMDVRRIETVKDGGEAIANRVRVKVAKNKLAPPFRQAEFELEFGVGISTMGCLLDVGVEHGVITRSGAHFAFGQQKLGQGRGNAKAYLTEHPQVAAAVEAAVYGAAGLTKATGTSRQRTALAAAAGRDGAASRDQQSTQRKAEQTRSAKTEPDEAATAHAPAPGPEAGGASKPGSGETPGPGTGDASEPGSAATPEPGTDEASEPETGGRGEDGDDELAARVDRAAGRLRSL